MKKLVVLILAFLYLSTSVGATVHLHFCMDKLVDWGLWQSNDKKCTSCGMDKTQEKKAGCCKDEQKQVKLESDHKAAAAYQLIELAWDVIPPLEFELQHINLPVVTDHNPLSHGPPRRGDIAVYIRNCVFRI